MKKIILMMALAATALFTVTACGDDDDDNGGNNNSTVTLTPPPYKNEAKVLDLQDNLLGLKQLRMMENGAYMIVAENDYNSRETRAVDLTSMFIEFGNFTITNGVFNFSNGMSITVKLVSGNNYDVTIVWKNGTTITTTGTLNTSNTVAGGVMTENLCSRQWKIEKLIVGGSINGTSVGMEFGTSTSSIKLAEVKQWYLDKGGKIQDEFDASAIITGILFDSKGLFTIKYSNHKPDVGTWRWSDMNAGKLGYSWNSSVQAISLFTGDASVSFETNPDKCILTLYGKINGDDMKFIFHLK